MPSTAIDSQIHGFLFSTDEMREIFSDRSWAQKWPSPPRKPNSGSFPHLLMIELIERLFRKHCTEVRQVIEARALPEEGARHLNAATGSPALRIVRNYVDESGEILLSTVSYHPGDRYAFNLNARVPEHKRNERLDETLFDRLRNES